MFFTVTKKIFLTLTLVAVFNLSVDGSGQGFCDEGLLFHLSGEQGFTADYAAGNPEPVLLEGQVIIDDGFRNQAIRCPDNNNVIAFSSPGNMFADRGTFAFFFRFRYAPGTTPFVIIQASYGDHSSFDMQWMRIDYNGRGFEAFVTDVNLARTRVDCDLPEDTSENEWMHMALAWDETQGVRFYINGELAAQKDTTAVYHAVLGYFGTHGYFLNPLFVGSGSTQLRGSDFDEIRIYDRMLEPDQISQLAKGDGAGTLPPLVRTIGDSSTRESWYLRHGWNRPGDIPPLLTSASTRIRVVGITDAYDLKQWFYKGNDGIRETTWPGVYNRSRIIGRNDYFVSPDWNCYSLSGKSITFKLSEEPWNHVEITGAAFGSLEYLSYNREHAEPSTEHLAKRPRDQERTIHRFDGDRTGGSLRFTNEVQETPIGELTVSHVTPGVPPSGVKELVYTIKSSASPLYPATRDLISYIDDRYPVGERSTVIALPSGAPQTERSVPLPEALPVVRILVPWDFRDMSTTSRYSYTWDNIDAGLDGIVFEIPAFDVEPTHGDVLPMMVSVRDPLWPERSMMDFSFSIAPGEKRTLWLDTRDRLLPNGQSLYIVVTAAGGGFNPNSLDGAVIRLVFKDRADAVAEHESDRFDQVRDNFGNILESRPNTKHLGLFDRFYRDITDLLRVNPKHDPGIHYWTHYNPEQGRLPFIHEAPPGGVPLWAFRQVEYLRLVSDVVLWWIDNRQIDNGELGGGISDDSDYTHAWPIPALMGVEPEKITDSLHRLLDACYDNGMITDGLNTYMMDGLHTTEEGSNIQAQLMMLEYGDPKLVERIMETARGYERITGINDAGHRHFRSSFFSASQSAEEGPWLWSMYQTFRILHPGLSLVEFNGNPRAKKLLLEMADGIVAHRKKDERGRYSTSGTVNFDTDEDRGSGFGAANHLLWAARCWTGDDRYLLPLTDNAPGFVSGLNADVVDILGKRDTWGKQLTSSVTPYRGSDFARHLAWQMSGNKHYVEEYYADQIQAHTQDMYMMTEGHIWTDRVAISADELQRSRLGGVARRKKAAIYAGQIVSWSFREPSSWDDLAILIPKATAKEFTVEAFNLSTSTVTAEMTGWMVDPGAWELTKGVDTDSDGEPDRDVERTVVNFGRTESLILEFPPRSDTVIRMKLRKSGVPYWKRPDIGIGKEDVVLNGNTLTVTVHSLGSVNAPSSRLVVTGPDGAVITNANVPSIEAPLDLFPRTAMVVVPLPDGVSVKGLTVTLNEGGYTEIYITS